MRISDWSSDVCSSDLAARGIVDRRGDAADPVLVFLEVERAARRDIAAHPPFPCRIIGRGRAARLIVLEQVPPMRGREIEQQRLAQPGRGQGMAIADADRDLDTSPPRNLVEIHGSHEIGWATWRERGCKYEHIPGVAVPS